MGLQHRIAAASVLIPAALFAAVPAHAARIVSEAVDGEKKSVEVLEFNPKGDLRVTSNGLDSMGAIVRDGRFYFFGQLDGKPVVVDMAAAAKKAAAQGFEKSEPKPAAETIRDIKPAGRRQTVAGLEGEVHVVTWAAAGKTRQEAAVLTRDPRLAALIRVLANPDLGAMSNKPAHSSLKEEAVARGYFLLQSSDYVVTHADFAPLAQERLALQAKPSDDIELAFQVMFATAFGEVGKAVSQVTDAVGAAVSVAAGGAGKNPFDAGRQWKGSYVCGQGATRLTLRIEGYTWGGSGEGGADVYLLDAVFDFDTGEGGAAGSFYLQGRVDTGTGAATFDPGSWIEQPPGYSTVGMSGQVSGDGSRYSGRITNEACAGFEVVLQPP